MLIRLRPTDSQPFSAYQLVTGYEPDISHLRTFGCVVYVPITPPLRTEMGPRDEWVSMLVMMLRRLSAI